MLSNIKTGIACGCTMASMYALYAIGLYLFRGPTPFEAIGAGFGAVIAAYFGAGIMGGAVVGALFPLTRSRIGATVVGVIAGFFVYLSLAIADSGLPSRWSHDDWVRYI